MARPGCRPRRSTLDALLGQRATIARATLSASGPIHDGRGSVFNAGCPLLELIAEPQNDRAPDV